MLVMWRPKLENETVDPQFLNCFMKIYGPKDNRNKFKKDMNVEIFSITSPTSHNTLVP